MGRRTNKKSNPRSPTEWLPKTHTKATTLPNRIKETTALISINNHSQKLSSIMTAQFKIKKTLEFIQIQR
jgi:hypothetical protein